MVLENGCEKNLEEYAKILSPIIRYAENLGAIVQGFKATVMNLSPLLWTLKEESYVYDKKEIRELKEVTHKEVPVVTMEDL